MHNVTGILGQGYGCILLYAIPGCTWDSPVLLGNPRILGHGYGCVLLYAIPGCTWDSPVLGNPGILGQGYGCVLLYAIPGCTWGHDCYNGMNYGAEGSAL